MKHLYYCVLFLFFFTTSIFAQEQNKDFYITKGKGYEFHFYDDAYELQVDFRGQFRAFTPFNSYPKTPEDFQDKTTSFNINRARIKIGGHVFKPYYSFYFEQDIRGMNLLDFRFMIEKYSFLKLKIGQWKSRFSRERMISSGNQQAVDRSLINSIFTIDRQQGISLYGDLDGGGAANFTYFAEVLSGSGRGGRTNDDTKLMYLLRLQWNPNGDILKYSGSDLEIHEKFVSSIAIAGVTNTSKYTAFSTSGGVQLYGFEEGIAGQYKIDQLLFETAFKYKGFSWEQELHYKNIDDKVNLEQTTLIGNYFQIGYFLNQSFPKIPKELEIFARQSFYDPNTEIDNNNNYEFTVGCNWFFHGHKNKLTFDYSYLKYNQFVPDLQTGNRFRLQWDISIF
jgi:phosphate-selective porin